MFRDKVCHVMLILKFVGGSIFYPEKKHCFFLFCFSYHPMQMQYIKQSAINNIYL